MIKQRHIATLIYFINNSEQTCCSFTPHQLSYLHHYSYSFSYSGAVLWNSLPSNIRQAESLTEFRQLLKHHIRQTRHSWKTGININVTQALNFLNVLMQITIFCKPDEATVLTDLSNMKFHRFFITNAVRIRHVRMSKRSSSTTTTF